VRDRLKMSFDEHEAAVNAIVAGDAEKTVEVLRQHITIQGQRFADLVASLHQLKTAA
jgi:DNA-binding GntR family transcriptional regulator